MAYKISKDSEAELRRAVSNFNSKIRRLEKTDRELTLPEKVNISIIKERVYDKRSLNREIDKLQTFTIRGMEEDITLDSGLKITKYEYENLLKEQKRLSAKLYRTQRKLEEITPTRGGKELHYKVKEMGREDLTNIRNKRKALGGVSLKGINKDDLKDFRELLSGLLRREKYDKSIFIDNFTNQMILNLGYWAGVDENTLKNIRDNLSQLSEREFMNLYDKESYVRAIKDYYNEINKKGITEEQMMKNMDKVKEIYEELNKAIPTIIKDYQ